MKYLEILRGKLDELAAARDAAVTEMEAITEGAVTEERSALTADEDASFTEARSRIDAIDTEAAGIAERVAELEAIEARTVASSKAPQHMQRTPTVEHAEEVRDLRRPEARDRALSTLEDRARDMGLRSDQLDKVDALIRHRTADSDGDVIARMLLTSETPAYRSAWTKLVTQPTPMLTTDEARAVQAFDEVRAMSSTAASGGYGVPVLIDPSIILTSQGSLNPFRRISRQITITTDTWKGVSTEGVSWSYDAEAATVSDDSPTLAQPTVSVHEARGFIPFSIRIGQDYPDFANEMAMLLSEGYDELQASAFVSGTGSAQPYGIITALDANTQVEVVVTTDGSFGGVDINAVWVALPDRYKGNATWVMSHDVGNEVASFGSTTALAWFTVDLTGIVETIRTRPVEYSSYFPTFTGTTGASNICVVGDFRNYLIVDRAGMSIELVPHLFDVTASNRPTGQRGWFAWARHGADSINDFGFRLLQNQ